MGVGYARDDKSLPDYGFVDCCLKPTRSDSFGEVTSEWLMVNVVLIEGEMTSNHLDGRVFIRNKPGDDIDFGFEFDDRENPARGELGFGDGGILLLNWLSGLLLNPVEKSDAYYRTGIPTDINASPEGILERKMTLF